MPLNENSQEPLVASQKVVGFEMLARQLKSPKKLFGKSVEYEGNSAKWLLEVKRGCQVGS